MSDTVRVRLVPRSIGGRPMPETLFAMTPRDAKSFAPDPDYTEEAYRISRDLGLEARQSSKNSLQTVVPRERFSELFSADLQAGGEDLGYESKRSIANDQFLEAGQGAEGAGALG